MTSRNLRVKLTPPAPLSHLVTNLRPLYRNYVTSLQPRPFKMQLLLLAETSLTLAS